MRLILASFVVILFSLAAAPKAEAGRIPIIIGYGEKISDVTDAPKGLSLPPGNVSLRYNSFRVFFFSRNHLGKEYGIYHEQSDNFQALTPEKLQAVEAKTGSLTFKGGIGALWAKYVNWLMVAGLIMTGLDKIRGKESAEE